MLTYPLLLAEEYQLLTQSRSSFCKKTSGAGRAELETLYEELAAIWNQNPTARLQRQLEQLSSELSQKEFILTDSSTDERRKLSSQYETALAKKWLSLNGRKEKLTQRETDLEARKQTLRQNILAKRNALTMSKLLYESGQPPELSSLTKSLQQLEEQLASATEKTTTLTVHYETLTTEQSATTEAELVKIRQNYEKVSERTKQQLQTTSDWNKRITEQSQRKKNLTDELQQLSEQSTQLHDLELLPLQQKLADLKQHQQKIQQAEQDEYSSELMGLNEQLTHVLRTEIMPSSLANLGVLSSFSLSGNPATIISATKRLTDDSEKLSARLNQLLGNLGINRETFEQQFDAYRSQQ